MSIKAEDDRYRDIKGEPSQFDDAATAWAEKFKTGEWFEAIRIGAFKHGAEHVLNFAVWYSGMEKEKVRKAYDRYLREAFFIHKPAPPSSEREEIKQ
jgi:hypothetical protein